MSRLHPHPIRVNVKYCQVGCGLSVAGIMTVNIYSECGIAWSRRAGPPFRPPPTLSRPRFKWCNYEAGRLPGPFHSAVFVLRTSSVCGLGTTLSILVQIPRVKQTNVGGGEWMSIEGEPERKRETGRRLPFGRRMGREQGGR